MDSSLLVILKRAHEARAINKHYRDRREHPRVPLEQPARLLLSDGERLEVTATDISRDAMQITCDNESAEVLHPDPRNLSQKPPLMVVVNVKLPMTSGVSELTAVGEIFSFTPLETGGAVFALRFCQFDEDGQETVDTFIKHSLHTE